MARDYFSRPNRGFTAPAGTTITDLQAALNAASGTSIAVDGLFGSQTEAALSTFQTQRGLPVSGTVSDTTWSALMRSTEPAIFERCLQVTASFEGTGFAQVVGNFDGAGITWGIIGFTLVNNELGAILQAINKNYPALITKAFGNDADEILNISSSSTSANDKLSWADSISRGNNNYAVAEPWRTYFSDLGAYREVQKIQVDRTRDIYWSNACKDAADLSIKEELDYLLMFDTSVQNGGMGSNDRLQTALQKISAATNPTSEEKRKIIAQVIADTSRQKFKSDVLSRKMAIATGNGAIHGGAYALTDWGFLDGYSPISP